MTMTTFLTACEIFGAIRVKVETDCIWFEEQKLRPQTKAWLKRHPEQVPYVDKKSSKTKDRFPLYVREDFNKYRLNNLNAEKFCEE